MSVCLQTKTLHSDAFKLSLFIDMQICEHTDDNYKDGQSHLNLGHVDSIHAQPNVYYLELSSQRFIVGVYV